MNPRYWSGLIAGLLVTACAPLPPVPPANAAKQQCLVCRHNRDFGCLEISKSPSTPQAMHEGRTYWFCDDSCRRDFMKSPDRYIPQF